MARARILGARAARPLDGTWEIAALAPGLAPDPADLEALRPEWMRLRRADARGGGAARGGRWDLEHPRDFDADDWWYRCRFAGGSSARPSRLRFEGLATVADVWLNGHHILRSESMFVAHTVDIARWPSRRQRARPPLPRARAAARREAAASEMAHALVAHQALRWHRTSLLGRMPAWCPPVAPVGPWRPILIETAPAAHRARRRPRRTRAGRRSARVIACVFRVACPRPLQPSATLSVGDCDAPLDLRAALGEVDSVFRSVRVPCPDAGGRTRTAVSRSTTSRVHRCWPAPSRRSISAAWGSAPSPSIAAPMAKASASSSTAFPCSAGASAGRRWTWRASPPIRPTIDRSRAIARCRHEHGSHRRHDGVRSRSFPRSLRRARAFWSGRTSCSPTWTTRGTTRRSRGSVRLESDADARVAPGPSVARRALRQQRGRSAGGDARALASRAVQPSSRASRLADLVQAERPAPCGSRRRRPADVSFSGGCRRQPLLRRGRLSAALRRCAPRRRAVRRRVPGVLQRAGRATSSFSTKAKGRVTTRDGRRACRATPERTGTSKTSGTTTSSGSSASIRAELRARDPERYLALGRVATGEAMLRTFAEWRRPGSTCRGGLVWFARDLWPGAGWGVIDSAGRPKAAYWYLRRALAPVALLTADEGLNGLWLHAVNDTAGRSRRTCASRSTATGRARRRRRDTMLSVPARGSHRCTRTRSSKGSAISRTPTDSGRPGTTWWPPRSAIAGTGLLRAAACYFPGPLPAQSRSRPRPDSSHGAAPTDTSSCWQQNDSRMPWRSTSRATCPTTTTSISSPVKRDRVRLRAIRRRWCREAACRH